MSTALVKPEVSASAHPVSIPAHDETIYSYDFEDYEVSYVDAPLPPVVQDFEGGVVPDYWYDVNGTLEVVATGSHSGTYCLRIPGPGNRVYAYLDAFDGVFAVEFWVKADAGVTLTIDPIIYDATFIRRVTATGTWQKISATGYSTDFSELSITASSGDVYLDDVSYTQVRTVGPVVNDGLDGWSPSGTGTFDVYDSYASSGRYISAITKATSSTSVTVTKSFSGLTAGRSYTFAAHASPFFGAPTAWLSTLTASPSVAVPWSGIDLTHTFTATATTVDVHLNQNLNGGAFWSNLTLTEHVPDDPNGTLPFPVSSGRITLDESWSPYAQASVDVPLSDLELLEQIDPRQAQRVVLTASETIGGSTRTFDLGLRSRTVDHKAGKVTLELASDEALLIDKRLLATTPDSTPRQHEASLRAVCQWALDKIGATLQPGTTDADVTAQWDAENLLLNPSAKTDGANWVSGSSSTAIAWNGGAGSDGGTGFIRATQTAATGAVFLTTSPSNQTANPGDMHTASVYVRHSAAGASARVVVRYLDANNVLIKDFAGALVSVTNTGWTRISATGTAPANTARVTAWVYFSGSASGRWLDLDQAMLSEGPALLPYFDGATTSTPNYTYSWSGAVNASASLRVATPERRPELFNWQPGQSLDDFLRPLTEASGLRLFCDEQRDWRLIDPTEYEVPGYVVAQTGHNATEGTDTISRNTDEWATGIVVVYRWRDGSGNTREQYDVAGTSEKVLTIERESVYPGPGAAAYILNSRTGRGRVQDVTVLAQLSATPAQDVTINLPGTLSQTGKVRTVTFGLRTGLMELRTRGLTDTLPGSWAAWDPDETWSEVAPTLKWKDA